MKRKVEGRDGGRPEKKMVKQTIENRLVVAKREGE